MSIPVKDFDKDVANFFKASSGFSYESKSKGPNKTVYINPGYEKGTFTVNAHYDVKQSNQTIKSKIAISDNDTLATKVIVEQSNKKFELNNKSNLKKIQEYSGDIIHQLTCNNVCFFVKSAYSSKTNTNADLQLSLAANKNVTLGAQVVFNCIKKLPDTYKIAARYSCCQSNVFSLSYDNKGTAALSACMNLKKIISKANVNAYFRFTRATATGYGLNLGFQHFCPGTGIRTQMKVDNKGMYGISLLRKFGDVSIHAGGNMKCSKKCCPFAPGQAFIEVSRD